MNSKAIREVFVAVIVFSVFVAVTSPILADAVADSLGVEDACGFKNTYVLVPVNITNVHSESIVGIEFEFLYDSDVINLAGVQRGDLTSQWSEPAKKGTEGDYIIGIVGTISKAITNGSTGSVVLLNLSIIGEPGETSQMNLSNIKFVNTTFKSGTAPAKNGTFTILTPTPPPLSLGEAVDNSALSWITGGNADWFGQTSTYYYGEDAAQSGAISHNQNSWIQTTVSGPGTLSFYWKVSSERNYDFLEFYIDDVRQDRISGNVDWQYKTYTISSGSHTLKWKYRKDVSINSGSDCGWLDKVEFSATSDLVGLWHFDEGSGTAAVDSSEYGNDGTIYGATWTTRKLGSALKFDGTDDYVDCGNDPSLNITDKITIMLWMKPAVAGEGGPNAAPVSKAESGIDWSWQLRYNAPGGWNYMGFQFNGDPEGSTWVSVKQNLSPGEWYHIAGTFDGTNIKCYLNGVEKDTNQISAIKGGNARLFIGQDGWDSIFNGTIDEVKIYNRALSEEEIKADYEAGLGDVTPPETTIMSAPDGTMEYNDVSFNWTGSDDVTPTSQLVYSYYLAGYDSGWSAWTSATSKSYNDLPNDYYTFKVKAKDEAGNEDTTPAERSFTVMVDLIPPASIFNLKNTTDTTWINWTWKNPTDADFNYTMVYLDGILKTNTSYNYYNATNLTANTSYEIGTHTVDINGNINNTWVNQTAKTMAVPNNLPVADPNGPYTGTEGIPITFDGSGSFDSDGIIVSYEWDFGDGNDTTEINPAHTYTQNGTYTVTLTVTDNDGTTDTNTTTATISDTEPIADFVGAPTNGSEPFTVAFIDTSASYDGITTWEWDFDNDGVIDSTEQNPTHVYNENGAYTMSLTIYESDGDSDTMTKPDYITVTMVNLPPVSNPKGPYTGTEGIPITFDGSGSYDTDGSIISYAWNFSDGNTSSEVTPTHIYAQNGTYTVTLTVTDNDGATNTNTTTATIADTEPTADFTAMPTSGPTPLTVAFTDTSASYDGITAWEWDFDNDGVIDSTAQNPTHIYSEEGNYSVSLTVYEADGDSDTETKADYITVTMVEETNLVGLWHFDEGSGTIAEDTSGNGNDGTLTNMDPATDWVDGKLGKALDFDGVDDHVNCGNDASLDITDKITIMLWTKPAVAGEGGQNAGPVCKAEAGIDWSWQLRYNAPGGGNYMGFQFNGDSEGSTWVSVQQNLSPGEWYHIAGTFDGTNIRCYLNGVAKDTNTISAIKGGSSTLFIGQDGWANIFNGVIDEVKIYNRALSAEEIKADYEVGSDTTPPTLTAHLPTGSEVSVGTNITVTFSEAMNTTSVESAFSVSPSVSGSFGWNGNEMIFTPDADIDYEMTYTITIATTAKDLAENNLTKEYSWQFTTMQKDTTPPVISNVTASGITSSSAIITWTTDEPADSLVKYGKEPSNYNLEVYDSADVTPHSVGLMGLLSNTTYYYVVNSMDPRDNSAQSSEYIFKTEVTSSNIMHVATLDMSTDSKSAGSNTFIWAVAMVTIVNNSGTPVEGATVSGHWSNARSDSDSGVTDASGQISLISDSVRNPPSGTTFTFTVDDVAKYGGTYDSSANVETSDSIIVLEDTTPPAIL